MKTTFLVTTLFLSFATVSLASDTGKGPPPAQTTQPPEGQQGGMGQPPTKETRAALAGIHEKFAACLRSDRQMKECGEEMQAGCAAMPNGRCGPGPGPGGMKGGMGGPGGMKKGGMNKGGMQKGGGF